MKKFLIMLTVILTISTVSFATFSDMPQNEKYQTAINGLVDKGVLNGYDDGLFLPSNSITRAEFVKMIVTATNATGSEGNSFLDVEENHWAKKFIDVALKNNFINGYEDNTFRPEDNISYGEVVTIIIRALVKDTKLDDTLVWPMNYMNAAEKLNLFDGYYTNDLVADNFARRDNVALILWNALNLKTEEKNESSVDTKTAYAGIVSELTEKRGEKFVTVEDGEFELYKKSELPEINSFVIFQLTSDKQMKIRKELTVADVDNTFLTVDYVEDTIVKLNGVTKVLDFELEKYELNGKEYKLSKYNFFVISLDDGKFDSFDLYDVNTLKLKKDDKIKFDEKLNICYVVREI